MDKVFKKVLIVDGSHMLHRALHLQSIFDLKNSKGVRTGGIYQFLKMINKEIRECGDYFPIVCFDDGRALRRILADENYKGNRPTQDIHLLTPEEVLNDYVCQYRVQRNRLITILTSFGIPSIKFKDCEGDDLIYIISKMSKESIILTDDKDMLQLLNPICKVKRSMANEIWDLKSFLNKNNYSSIYDFVLYKAILGDSSDNIPSACKGVGEGTIRDFIKLVYYYYENDAWNLSAYPNTEEDMKRVCEKEVFIKYKKAFLNFDVKRFLTNLELVDLTKVEIDEKMCKSIIATCENTIHKLNFFDAIKLMGEYEITEVSVDDLIVKVNHRMDNLFVK